MMFTARQQQSFLDYFDARIEALADEIDEQKILARHAFRRSDEGHGDQCAESISQLRHQMATLQTRRDEIEMTETIEDVYGIHTAARIDALAETATAR
jgi:hypothetical protein